MRSELSFRIVCGLLAAAAILAACGGDAPEADTAATGSPAAAEATAAPTEPAADPPKDDEPRTAAVVDPASLPRGEARDFGPAPDVPTGDLGPETVKALNDVMGPRLLEGVFDQLSQDAIDVLGQSGDPRVAWWLSDLMRIAGDQGLRDRLTMASSELIGVEINPFDSWSELTDHLIAWDIPAPPDYLTYKRNAYLLIEPRWDPLFVEGADVDWRVLSWGGVRIDNRAFDQTDEPCNCIPAADNPETTDVAGGDEWLDDDTIVFGVTINGESRAYPRSIMEVREMVNDTLGGRDFAMPYCTLCGSAQVWFTDDVPDGIERPVLRTSGLLTRSNKVMYDVTTFSIFDTFRGQAVSGPLLEAGIELDQHSVITTTWSQWKQEHPDTTVLAIELALGRPDSDLRNTRDANGPIFPIGDVDPRLPVQEDVLGLLRDDGTAIAFHVNSAKAALERGEFIEVDGIEVILDGGGVRAINAAGDDLGGHQAFWFAWSQFYPDTDLWPQ